VVSFIEKMCPSVCRIRFSSKNTIVSVIVWSERILLLRSSVRRQAEIVLQQMRPNIQHVTCYAAVIFSTIHPSL